MEITLIGDDRIKQIKVQECGNPFVDFAERFPELKFDHDRKHVQKKSKSISWGREEVSLKIVEAQNTLPNGLNFLIKECYRPLWIQREFFESYSSLLRKKFPDFNDEQIYRECSKLNAPVEVAPHSTGGAVDLTLIDANGNWLEMGTEFNAEPSETENATYTSAQNVSDVAKANRAILIAAMTAVGFQNYLTEWWHWSYGDKYWAFMTGAECAVYSSQEDILATVP